MISFENVAKAFHGKPVLDSIRLDLPPGRCMVLYGPSGCGKTTLLRLAAGFEQPDQGVIRINRQTVSTPKRMVRPCDRSIGMVFQDLALWPHMTVAEHLVFVLSGTYRSARRNGQKINDALAQVGLNVYPGVFPHQLSGGERQRLALARALIGNPEILLMDEPLCSLDTMLRSKLLRRIKTIIKASSITTLYVTHDLQEALYIGDFLAVMDQGRIRSIEPVETCRLNGTTGKQTELTDMDAAGTPRLERAGR